MRSSLQPTLFFLLNKALNLCTITNPFSIVLVFRLLHALFSFFSILWLTRLLLPKIKDEKNKTFFVFLSLLFWCLPYFHARHSSENLSSSIFILALCFFLSKNISNNFLNLSVVGLLSGLAFVIRFQAGFMVFGFALWLLFIHKEKLLGLIIFTFSVIASIGIGILIDKWFYGNWTFTAYNYLNINIIQNKVADFGQEPWYFFISQTFLQLIPPFSILIIISFVVFWIKNPKHFLTWITFIYIAIHFMVSHKELRFLFPMINFLPFVFCSFADNLKEGTLKLNWLNFILKPVFVKIFIVINSILLLVMILKPADVHFTTLRFCYNNYNSGTTTFLYKEANPYSKDAALSYYKTQHIIPMQLLPDSSQLALPNTNKIVYYTEEFIEADEISLLNKKFKKVYCTWPNWIKHFNINNWLSRSFSASVFEME